MEERKPSSLKSKKCVTIFGGGVAGLTAAHELVERGFRVQVWEPQTDARHPERGCDVGGMARSQWSRLEWQDTTTLPATPAHWPERQTQEIRQLPQTFYIKGQQPLDKSAISRLRKSDVLAIGATGPAREIERVVKEMSDELVLGKIRFLYCEVQFREAQKFDPDAVRSAVDLFNDFLAKFVGPDVRVRSVSASNGDYEYPEYRRLRIEFPKAQIPDVQVVVVPLDGFPDGVPAIYGTRISYRVRERWIPGEHGFRFFPSFYYHLFDTMKRTPILEPANKSTVGLAQERSVTVSPNTDKYVESGRTAFDNLNPTSKQAFGFAAGSRPSILSRFAPSSLEDVRKWAQLVFSTPKRDGSLDDGFGFTPRDMGRYQTEVLKYLTSCDARRKEYEEMSWMDFIGGPSAYSENFVEIMNSWPEALVAMDAKTVDARSHGSVMVQLMLDNLHPAGYRDGTLAGPTSEAWFRYWRTYLEAQGVEFIHGKITGFQRVKKGGRRAWPTVECYEPRYSSSPTGEAALMDGYFVMALPVKEAQAMAKAYDKICGKLDAPNPDLVRLAKFLGPNDLKTDAKDDTGQLRNMVGIQYYFDEDVYWLDGHVYFPRSPWGVSAISQVRFWQDKQDWEHGYRGVLSVVFSAFGNPYKDYGTPLDCTPTEIAQAVWGQITDGLPKAPQPDFWHLDDTFRFDPKTKKYANSSPYLINRVGTWRTRPGEAIDPNLPNPPSFVPLSPPPRRSGYDATDGIVLAGAYMKTFTRITTMESANESARHAVNAILADSGVNESYCDIWPMEEREVDDFQFLKDLDAELYRRGQDHFVDILELNELAGTALRGTRSGVRDLLDPLGILAELGRLAQQYVGGTL